MVWEISKKGNLKTKFEEKKIKKRRQSFPQKEGACRICSQKVVKQKTKTGSILSVAAIKGVEA